LDTVIGTAKKSLVKNQLMFFVETWTMVTR